MRFVERGITDAVVAVGNADSPELRQLNLVCMLGDDEVGTPSGMVAARASNGPDAFVLGCPSVVEVKRSSTRSKVRGPHVVHTERIMRQGLRPGDPDGDRWFEWLKAALDQLEEGLRGWHDANGRCWAVESAPCRNWFHALARIGRTCVACPQPAPYLYCKYEPPGVSLGPTSRLVVLGGAGDGVQDFYGGDDAEYGPNLTRFVLTTHVRYLNRLAGGLGELRVGHDDLARVKQVTSLMWQDMTCEEAALLDPAVDRLLLPEALDAFGCECPGCARWSRLGSVP